MVQDPNEPSAFGLTANIAAGLASLFAGIGSLIILLGKPPQAWVRFVAVQSIVICVALFVADFALGFLAFILLFLPYVGPFIAGLAWWLLIPVLGLAAVVAWIMQTIKAFQGSVQRFPIVSDWTDRFMPAAANMVASSTYTPPPSYTAPPPPPTYTPPPPPPPPTPPDTTP